MRIPDRDRCRSAIAALCLAAVLITAPAFALSAEYRILPNGTSFLGEIEIKNAEQYQFTESGMLGEKIPVQVTGVSLSGDCFPCCFTWQDRSTISFPAGNYTVRFTGNVRDNHLVVAYPEQYNVTMIIPEGLDVRSRFLGMISPGGEVSESKDGNLVVTWRETRSAEVRYYPPERENLLIWFGQFWVIIAVVLLLPFFLMKSRKE
jgi:hypothetical protein